MPKSRNRKNHKQKVKHRNMQLLHDKNRKQKQMQEYFKQIAKQLELEAEQSNDAVNDDQNTESEK